MKVIVKQVVSDDWEAIYINNERVIEDHHVPLYLIFEWVQELIDLHKDPITEISGERYYLNDNYAEECGFPKRFSDIPEDMFE